jgi:hypothetical protein
VRRFRSAVGGCRSGRWRGAATARRGRSLGHSRFDQREQPGDLPVGGSGAVDDEVCLGAGGGDVPFVRVAGPFQVTARTGAGLLPSSIFRSSLRVRIARQTVMTTFPRACPSSMYRMAWAASVSG